MAMRFRVDEISSVITEEIRHYRSEVDFSEVGRVLEVGDGIARVYGLTGAMSTVSILYDLSRRLTLRARAGTENAIDLIFTQRYD